MQSIISAMEVQLRKKKKSTRTVSPPIKVAKVSRE